MQTDVHVQQAIVSVPPTTVTGVPPTTVTGVSGFGVNKHISCAKVASGRWAGYIVLERAQKCVPRRFVCSPCQPMQAPDMHAI